MNLVEVKSVANKSIYINADQIISIGATDPAQKYAYIKLANGDVINLSESLADLMSKLGGKSYVR